MNSNQLFSVSCHILAVLAVYPDAIVTSETIALSVDTNPVVIRRLLASLRAAKLVSSQGGPGGGWQLLKDPKEISLRDVLAAVEGSSVFALHSTVPNPLCPVGRTIQSLLAGPFRSAQEALEQDLARTTIAALAESAKG